MLKKISLRNTEQEMWVPFGSKERQKTTITTMHCAVRINTGHLSFRREKNKNKNTHGTESWFLINQRILVLQLSINSVSLIIRTETLLCCFLFFRHKICFLSLLPVECPSTFYLKLQDAAWCTDRKAPRGKKKTKTLFPKLGNSE